MKETLLSGLPALRLSLSEAQADRLCTFGQLLLEKNAVMNLTAITEPQAVAQLHFLDSLALLNAADFANRRVIDVGCGAGFPGVPLAIAEPTMDLTLLDSLGKRMAWLAEILPGLGVRADCVSARAEEHVLTCREQFDIATSRAVARLNVLCELCLPYVKVGGVFIAMKGADAEAEVREASSAISQLGARVAQLYEYSVAGAVHRAVVLEKVRPTPARFPRRYSKIKQQPL